MKVSISVTLITLNEEANIEEAIMSARLLTQDIIVVDSASTDKTIAIAKKCGAQVYVRDFDNYAAQKNFAASKVATEWIFSLDADERITKELANEINTKLSNDTKYDGYLIPRRNFILGGEIKHSRWSPDRHIWLWKKSKGKWVGKVHEELNITGEIGEMENAKIHYQDQTISEFLDSLNKYTQIEAEELYKKGKRFNLLSFCWYPTRSFLGRYFYKQGFLDGWRGFVLCSLRAIYHGVVWLKLFELEKP